MAETQDISKSKKNKRTSNTHVRKGGPMTEEQRSKAMLLFIESLKVDPNVTLACDQAEIGRTVAYEWRDKYPEFGKEWDTALERTKDVARSSIYKRGIIGWDEPLVSVGKLVRDENGEVVMVRKWSDPLAALYAKSNLPEYKEKQRIELTGKNDGPIEIETSWGVGALNSEEA